MNSAAWAWVVLIVSIVLYVVGYDVWATVSNHQTMSGEFHNLMQHQILGPALVALWVGASTGLIYHFLINK